MRLNNSFYVAKRCNPLPEALPKPEKSLPPSPERSPRQNLELRPKVRLNLRVINPAGIANPEVSPENPVRNLEQEVNLQIILRPR